jgi:hypothetical protein
MSAMIIGVVMLVLVALGVGIYFLVSAKKCKDYDTQDKCKEPCKWDTRGNKCIEEDEDLTPAPPAQPVSVEQEANEQVARVVEPQGTETTANKWKCYAGTLW